MITVSSGALASITLTEAATSEFVLIEREAFRHNASGYSLIVSSPNDTDYVVQVALSNDPACAALGVTPDDYPPVRYTLHSAFPSVTGATIGFLDYYVYGVALIVEEIDEGGIVTLDLAWVGP